MALRDYFPSRGPHRDYIQYKGRMYAGWVWSWLRLFRIVK